MSIGDSDVSICNIALIALGEDPIVSLQDNSKPAILCNARYGDIRRAVLEANQPGCAKTEASLALSATVTSQEYDNVYGLPAGFLRLVNIIGIDSPVYEIKNGYLYINDTNAPLWINYIIDLQDASVFTPTLVHTIAYSIVVEIGPAITQDTARVQLAMSMLADKAETQRLSSSQQASPKEWDEDVLLRSRR